MASGAIEQDFRNITPGEAITLRWTVEDSAGVAVTSFSGWTTKAYFLSAHDVANGLTELEASSLLKLNGTLSVPTITAALTPANWSTMNAAMNANVYHYELWRTDSTNETRLAYGKIITLD